ncbi:protein DETOXIFICATION 27-like [Salvia hispanica]|uniref:protein DETOXIFICATION 27-like n=1 Tax=Salvia hispanica TaxID=49212 RepID=UPI0020096717|nr:protein DETOXIFICATION 27-like [Salvia hispanica]
MSNTSENGETQLKVPLLEDRGKSTELVEKEDGDNPRLSSRVWVETKKLWRIVGPAIFSRMTSYTMFVITQAFAGHLGDLELAAMSIASNVIVGFDFGLLLGMASALETLCGQAFGAKKYYMLGIYLQRSWIVLFACCVALLPLFFYATPILKAVGQPDDVAELSGTVALVFIPLHFSFAFTFPLQRFLQSQLKNSVTAYVNLVSFIVHVLMSYLLVYRLSLGLVATAFTLNISWWITVFGQFIYVVGGGCPHTWTGFSTQAFCGLWDFLKLSASSGVMLCLENWYYRILIVMTGNLKNATIAVDALSVWCLNDEGVAVGSGWQSYVAYINLGCYYLVGVPLGVLMGWVFDQGVMGIWAGMIFGGTAVQTLILAIITIRCDWEKEAAKATMHVDKWSDSRNTA